MRDRAASSLVKIAGSRLKRGYEKLVHTVCSESEVSAHVYSEPVRYFTKHLTSYSFSLACRDEPYYLGIFSCNRLWPIDNLHEPSEALAEYLVVHDYALVEKIFVSSKSATFHYLRFCFGKLLTSLEYLCSDRQWRIVGTCDTCGSSSSNHRPYLSDLRQHLGSCAVVLYIQAGGNDVRIAYFRK